MAIFFGSKSYKILSIGVALFVFFALISIKLFSTKSYEKIEFSSTKYPEDISLFRTHLDKEWRDLIKLSKAGVEIGVDKIDLNQDGVKDVLVYVAGTLFGGSHGYTTEVYISQKDGWINQPNVWPSLTFGEMVVLNTKHDGYRDIVFLGGDPGDFNKPMLHYCYWKNGKYDFDHSVPFKNEFGGFQ